MKTLTFLFLLTVANMAFAISEQSMDCGYGTPEESLVYGSNTSTLEGIESSQQ